MPPILAHIPEVPVKEMWEWLTDVLTSNDGSEQRIALRGSVPRVTQEARYLFTEASLCRKFRNDLLTALNEMWVPEWQWATKITAQTLSGGNRIYYTPSHTDIRAGEHVIIAGNIYLVSSLQSDGCIFTTNLISDALVNTIIAPVGLANIEDNSSLSRYAVNEVLESSLTSLYSRARTSMTRPGTSSTVATWNSLPVLDARPLADSNVQDSFMTGQIVIDNKIGKTQTVNNWDYSREGGARTFIVQRTPITEPCSTDARKEIDWWRHFLSLCRGGAKKFYMPTFRPDLDPDGAVSDAASNILVHGVEYAQNIYPSFITHRQLEITSTSGTHRCSVTNAVVSGASSRVYISPSLPSGAGWSDIQEISYLPPMRIVGDSVEWEHFGLHSFVKLNVRTAE